MTLLTPGYAFNTSLWMHRSLYPSDTPSRTGEASSMLYSIDEGGGNGVREEEGARVVGVAEGDVAVGV